jgi:arginine-tRNA-protein transferase
MQSLYRYLARPVPCSYLPDQTAQIEYEYVLALSIEDYTDRLLAGWRRFGASLFRPRCRLCRCCQSMRVDVARFRPDRSQRRAWKANADSTRLRIGPPGLSAEKLLLYDRYHQHQAETRDWPEHDPRDADSYRSSFVENPIPTEEWSYLRGSALVGVGYVDALPIGLSAIYFYHDPDHRGLSLGTFNVLRLVAEAADRGLPHVYLGYYVAACPSLAYKARFRPSEVLAPDGTWQPFTPEP